MRAEQVLAFRLARVGLARRNGGSLAEAAACPASAFVRDADLMALSARRESLTRDEYDDAVDSQEVVLAHIIRGAIHVLAPGDLLLFGRALVGTDDKELTAQIGRQFGRVDALEEVTDATKDALRGGRALTKDELHDELRERVRAELLPWCKSCGSHHVDPSLWRYATVKAGTRLDSGRRYLLGKRGRTPPAAEAVRRFLRFYGPATAGDFAEWAGVTRSHADRIWAEVEEELSKTTVGRRGAWMLEDDAAELESPPQAKGVRLIPPGDPYLAKPNRPLLASDAGLRKRLFRPVASRGAVLKDGRLAGLWRVKAKGKAAEISVEKLGRLSRAELESPPQAKGVRLIPPGDPYLAKPNRPLLASDAGLRKRLFRPVASPGAVLKDGRLAGLWRVKAKGKAAEISVEKLGRLSRAELEPEAGRIAALRGAAGPALILS